MTDRTTSALVLHGPKDLRFEQRQILPPTNSTLQIAIKATGLCGSDLHYYNHGRNGDFTIKEPLVLGHESFGTVIALGPDLPSPASPIQVGDRVALEVGLPCENCALCKRGRYNICPHLRFRSSAKTYPHLDGTLVGITNHPARWCHKLPATVSDVGGALLEPLAVCLHAIQRSRVSEVRHETAATGVGAAALVLGAGAIGLLLASASATGDNANFTTILVADIDERRLEIARSLGLGLKTTLIPRLPLGDQNPPPPAHAPQTEQIAYAMRNAQELATALKQASGEASVIENGFTRVYDCTGVPACVQAGIYASEAGGTLVQIGMGNPVQTLPVGAAALREVDVIGVFRYDGRAYPAAIELMGSGKLRGVEGKIVTHRVRLEEGERAFGLAGKGVDEDGRPVVKTVIES